jgi:moderate conductance mechanosensitive channel
VPATPARPPAPPKAGKGTPAVTPRIVITPMSDELDAFGLFFERTKGVARTLTVKFNLRFARDTDLEKLRKAAKQIGAEGVVDITDNALLVRFKFTARPGNPASIQREAVKRLFGTLPGLGVEFAKEGAAGVLHTTSATMDPAPVGVAAAASTQPETPLAVAAS